MLGVRRTDGQVMVLASRELTRAELSDESEHESLYNSFSAVPMRMTRMPMFRVTCDMRTYVIVVGADYPQAVDAVFRSWS
jgi:hypothetical protein